MPGALAGLCVVDLSNTLMAPYATQQLGDMGADVIKVEPPEGDPVRAIGPGRNPDMGPIFLQTNRGKRSIVLDLKKDAGRQALLRLVRRADVLVYNMRPAVMVRLGLSYEAVAAVAPSIIYAGMIGFGQDGPYAGWPAYDDLIQGMAAIPDLTVRAGAPEPRYVPLAMADRVVGLYGAGAILGALWHRERTGVGQRIDIPMFETMAGFVLADHMGGRVFDPPAGPMGYARQLSKDRRPYVTRDGHVCTLIYNDGHWRRFLSAIGRAELWTEDPRFRSIAERTEHIDELYGMVADILRHRTTDECVTLLRQADIPVAPMMTLENLVEDPHLAAKEFIAAVAHPTEGALRMPGIAAQFSRTPGDPGRPAARLGTHSREVLAEHGYTGAEIDALIEDGVTREASKRD